MTDRGYADFEFERRFWVRRFPDVLRDAPALVIQSYFLAEDGYALRIRATAQGIDAQLGPESDPLEVLDAHHDAVALCTLTAKGPMVGGTRYEAEREIDPGVGMEMIRLGGHRIVKTRYSVWLGADGWVVDAFAGDNAPLIIAECERSGPVTDLAIPDFCVTEITNDPMFANDWLAHRPYSTWSAEFTAELKSHGGKFATEFGSNTHLGTDP